MVICKSPTSLHKGHLHPQLLVSLESLVLVLYGFGRSTVVCFSNISLALSQRCVLFQIEGLVQGIQQLTPATTSAEWLSYMHTAIPPA